MGWQGPGHSDRLWCETWGTSFTGPWASDGCEGCRGTVWLLDSPPPPSSDGCPARLLVDCPARGPGCHEGLHGSGLVQSAVALAESLGWGAAAPLLQLSLLPSQDGDRACPSRWPCLGPRGYQSCGGCWRCLQCMEWVAVPPAKAAPGWKPLMLLLSREGQPHAVASVCPGAWGTRSTTCLQRACTG